MPVSFLQKVAAMNAIHPIPIPKGAAFAVDNWPMSLEATRQQLQKAQKRLDRYRAALRLAGVEIERRNRGIIALTTFTAQASRAATPTTLLKLALVQALETINAPTGAIILIDADTKELVLGIHKGLTTELHNTLTGQQLDTSAMALMPHLVTGSGALLEYKSTTDKTEIALLVASRLTSLVSLPLQLGPRLIGAFLVGLQGTRTFSPAELCFLMAISQATTIALEGLRLRESLWNTAEVFLGEETIDIDLQKVDQADIDLEISTPFDLPATTPNIPQPADDDLEQLLAAMMEAEDEVQQQNTDLQTLNTIADMMNSTLDLREILQCTVDQTKTTLETDAAWVYLVNERNQLEMSAHIGLSANYVIGMKSLKRGDGLEGKVAVENKARFVEAVPEDEHRYKIWVDKEGLHALAAVPISRLESKGQTGQLDSRAVGVLVAGKRTVQAYAWTPREMRLLTSIANQVALAIDNARLHAQVQDDQVSLKAGNQVLQEINDMLLEKNTFIEGFIHDDLDPALGTASQIIQDLLVDDPVAATAAQKKKMVTLQRIIGQLSKMSKETSDVGEILNTEFDRARHDDSTGNDYAKSTKPVRLEPKRLDDKRPADVTERCDEKPEPTTANKCQPEPKHPKENNNTPSKAMSFEEAIAAGLVPAHILNREK